MRVAFFGRLVAEKGVEVLLQAMRQLDQAQLAVDLDVIGMGDLLERCRAASAEQREFARVNLRDTVPYGDQLFEALRGYHAVVVPSISDEQPRIVFDAFSQAVPVIASDTSGLRSCVSDGATGLLVRPDDADAIAGAIRAVRSDIAQLERMGLAGLEVARRHTHREMHERRHRLLLSLINDKSSAPAGHGTRARSNIYR